MLYMGQILGGEKKMGLYLYSLSPIHSKKASQWAETYVHYLQWMWHAYKTGSAD